MQQQLAEKETEIRRLQSMTVDGTDQRFRELEALHRSQLAEKDLQAQARLEEKLIEQKIEMRSKHMQQLQKLKAKIDTLGHKELEYFHERAEGKLGGTSLLTTLIDRSDLTEAKEELKGVAMEIKADYERKVKLLKQQVKELARENEKLQRALEINELNEGLCRRCRAFTSLRNGLDQQIARANSLIEGTPIKLTGPKN